MGPTGDEIDLPAPVEGSTFDVSIRDTLVLEPSLPYILVLEKSAVAGVSFREEAEWVARLVLTAGGSPVAGTPTTLLDDLGHVRGLYPDSIEAVVALAVDLEDQGRAFAESTTDMSVATPSESPRTALEALRAGRAAREAAEEAELARSLSRAWLAQPDIARQLPEDPSDLEPWMALALEELGTDGWARWTVVVAYDQATSGNNEWIGLFFPGAGFVGPDGLSDAGTVILGAYAPADVEPEVLLWPIASLDSDADTETWG